MMPKESIIQELSNIIVKLRKEKKMTQDDLAKATGTSPMTVQRVEASLGGTRLDNIISIVQGLNLRLVDVFKEIEGLPNDIPALNSSWEKAKTKISGLSHDEKEWYGDIILKMLEKNQKQ